jgi:hypothetical protein
MPLLLAAVDGMGVDKDAKVEALLVAGADPHVRDKDGLSPLARAVGALCEGAPDLEDACGDFFAGLFELPLKPAHDPAASESFVDQMRSIVRGYVESFAANIPLAGASSYEGAWRRERIECIAVLAAYEATVRPKGVRRSVAWWFQSR